MQKITESGVEQNPCGRNAKGERVWGGGIIPLHDQSKWIPWPLDIILLEYSKKRVIKEKKEKEKKEDIKNDIVVTSEVHATGLAVV